MADRDTLFWPSLYSRLAPSRYGEDPAEEEPGDLPAGADPDRERLAAAESFGQQDMFTDFATLRRHVETELVSLLNATCLESALLAARLRGGTLGEIRRDLRADAMPFADFPEVRDSIVNYGLPAIIGAAAFSLPVQEVELRIREAIQAFEPRIRPDTLRIRVLSEKAGALDAERPLEFVIEGEIRGADEAAVILINTIWDPQHLRSGAKVAV